MPPVNATGNDGVWVVVPAYKEAARIQHTLEELVQKFPNVIVVDDGSPDESGAIARSCGAWVLRHPINRGQGAALQTGIDFALIKGATDLLADVLNKPPGLTFVVIQEVELEDWGVNGQPAAEHRRQAADKSPG